MDVITRHRLSMLSLASGALDERSVVDRVQAIYAAFLERVPYENLSNNRIAASHPDDPESWPRATDLLLRENAALGLGGTSFSLAYALRDLFRGAGANAYCTLGYNLVTEQAHAAVIVYVDEGPLLYDPALLTCGPIPVRPYGELRDPLGCVRLLPRCGPTLTVSLELDPALRAPGRSNPDPGWVNVSIDADQNERAIYSIIPVPAAPQNFRQAWQASFYRGRRMPLRLARRVGTDIIRYGERPGSIEILRPDGREEIQAPADPVPMLVELFGIDETCLAEWFAAS